jgi:hypothetical protein
VAQFYLSVWHHYKNDLPSGAESLLVSTYAGFLGSAAERGHAEAQLDLGLRYAGASEASGDPEELRKATVWFRKAAEQGHPHAQFNLALAHHEGRGVPQNYTEAVKWYQAAADAGVAEAQLNLGLMYRQGEGVPQDYRAASHWFRKAADQDYAKAQAYLGSMYASGAGVPQDYARAHMWLNLAVASFPPGDTRDLAIAERDSVAARMTRDQIAEAQRMAREWLEQHRTGGAQ